MIVLVDTDYIIASLFDHESTHNKALHMAPKIRDAHVYCLDLVLIELANVTSRKYGQDKAITTLNFIRGLKMERASYHDYEKEGWKLFRSQTKKGTSFVDCVNLAAAQKMKAKIASFDSFYPPETLL